MTDSVWWYVLAGFLLGFILSTLWEWLYFRRRRMQIENQRIAELEATVRSLSTISQSAEANTSSGFAAGYQSPMVFLEGEEDDVDTVEVIVPAPAEPTDYDQPITGQALSAGQPRAETQFVAAKAASTGRTQASNGNGVVREAPSETQKVEPAVIAPGRVEPVQSGISPVALAAVAAAATAWASDKERPAESPYPQEQTITEPPAAEIPAREVPVAEIAVAETPAAATVVQGVPAEQAVAEQTAQDQSPQEHIPGLVGDLAPSRQISSVSPAPDEAERTSTRAQSPAQPAPGDQPSGTPAAAALVSAAALDDRQTVPQQQPEDVVDQNQGVTAPQAAPQAAAASMVEAQPTAQRTEGATTGASAEATGQPTGDVTTPPAAEPATQTREAQPVIAEAFPPPAVPGQPERQKPEEESGLTPAGVAVLVSALASKLAGDQQRPPEASQQQASQPPASQVEPPAVPSQAAAPESQTASESAPPARVMPVVADIQGTQPDTQPDVPSDVPSDAPSDQQCERQDAEGTVVTGVNAEQDLEPAKRTGSLVAAAEAQATGSTATASPSSAPAEEEQGGPAALSAIDSAKAPQPVAPQEQERALPLSAILPLAAKPAPLSKGGQAARSEAAQASAIAASGIEPEIEQVSNQLDDLIDSINGLIERTQPLLEPPASQVPPAETPATFASPTTVDDLSADDSGTGEEVDTGVTGPYSAQNLSRMEYGLVQLMQSVRRLGRDVRSAF